ncbi:membrane protein [Arthrobacter sp. RIT-PI-e]|nr:membrane protein [Arthrobacter sp. RIT-PI-e]
MNTTAMGLLTGLVLGWAAAFGGFGEFLTVAVLGALGLLVARLIEGKIDLGALTGRSSTRR